MFGSSIRKSTAFTLAEVLITLGIIGVVAALTIPALVNNVQKRQYVVALQKFYTTQMDGWSRLLADEGSEQLEDTSVFHSIDGSYCSIPDASGDVCKPLFDNLKKYFSFSIVTAPSYKIHLLNGDEYDDYTDKPVLAFADGSIMFYEGLLIAADKRNETRQAQIEAGGGHMHSMQGEFYIDVNGFKKPNVFGRDIFYFELSGDGKLYTQYGKDWSLFWSGNSNQIWQNNTSCGTVGNTDMSSVHGDGCAARIMDEGWQMNY
jgi:competence protein ComGC